MQTSKQLLAISFLLSCMLPFTSCDDESPACLKNTFYQDLDEDGRGNPSVFIEACEAPEGYVEDSTDDDDNSPCPAPISWYADFDGDGLGNPNISVQSCEEIFSYVTNGNDTNDYMGDNAGEVSLHNEALADDSHILINELGTNRIRLISKDGTTLSMWNLGEGEALANDAELLPNGTFLYSLKVNPPPFNQGGYGGKVAMRDANKNLIWEYEMSSPTALHHHDAEMLPNGNILLMAWDQKTEEEILAQGYTGEASSLNTESIYEINPSTNSIVWEWHAWDHLIQDEAPTKANFGSLSENPQKINLNYVKDQEGFMHANGIDYDEERDLIFISVRYYSEVWIIDHSTTSEEAKGEKGDLVYRLGNPEVYKGEGEQIFHWQHQPNLLEGSQPGKGNLLVFSNQHQEGQQSAIIEVELPENLEFGQEPKVVWEYSHPDLFSAILSGAERLPNGNTLITSGTQGSIWEVTPEKEVAWRFDVDATPPTRFWRSYVYPIGSPALNAIGLPQ